jgi:hypothetical protein
MTNGTQAQLTNDTDMRDWQQSVITTLTQISSYQVKAGLTLERMDGRLGNLEQWRNEQTQAKQQEKQRGPVILQGWLSVVVMAAAIFASMACSAVSLLAGHLTFH